MESTVKEAGFPFLKGGGEMGKLIRDYDWSETSLGGPAKWPKSLSTIVGLMLRSKFPMFLWWGEEMIQFYNDAYRPSLGVNGKHPLSLGQKGKECWPEIWDIIHPLIVQVKKTGEATWREDQLVPIYRNGKIEDVFWTYSYSEVLDDFGNPGGIFVTCVETTEKIKNHKQLEESNDQLQFAIEATELGTFDLNPLTNNLKGNARLRDWFGMTSADAVDFQTSLNSIVEKDRMRVEDALKQAFDYSSGGYYDIEYTINNSGTPPERTVRAKGRAWFDENKIAYRFNGTIQDITEEAMSKRKAKESEVKLKAIIEAAPAGIGLFVGRDLIIEMPNQTFIDIVGKGSNIEGKPLREVMPELVSANQPFLQILDDVYTTGKMFQNFASQVSIVQQGVMTHKFYYITYTPVFNTEGDVYAVLDIAIDVTEQVEARRKVEENEQNLRNTILQAPVAMCILKGPTFIVEIANQRMFELWGRSESELLNKPIFSGLPEAKGQGFEALLLNVYTTGKSYTNAGQAIVLPRNGILETVYLNYLYEAFREADGFISGIMAVSIDVTGQVLSRHKIEEEVAQRTRELADANLQLQQQNVELNQFAYIASHDLQEPLRKVRTFASLMESNLGDIPPKARDYMSRIQSATERMQALINDVLTFSKLSKAKEKVSKVNLNKVLRDILNDYDLLIDQKNAIISADELPVIDAIHLQMNQLFTNIISNALKFAGSDSQLHITIKAKQLDKEALFEYTELDQDKVYYHLEFIDNGIGFDQAHAQQIFTIFQRLHGKNDYAGTGIGLAMCKKIVQNHQGVIYAKSNINQGSVFTIILPEQQTNTG